MEYKTSICVVTVCVVVVVCSHGVVYHGVIMLRQFLQDYLINLAVFGQIMKTFPHIFINKKQLDGCNTT